MKTVPYSEDKECVSSKVFVPFKPVVELNVFLPLYVNKIFLVFCGVSAK